MRTSATVLVAVVAAGCSASTDGVEEATGPSTPAAAPSPEATPTASPSPSSPRSPSPGPVRLADVERVAVESGADPALMACVFARLASALGAELPAGSTVETDTVTAAVVACAAEDPTAPTEDDLERSGPTGRRRATAVVRQDGLFDVATTLALRPQVVARGRELEVTVTHRTTGPNYVSFQEAGGRRWRVVCGPPPGAVPPQPFTAPTGAVLVPVAATSSPREVFAAADGVPTRMALRVAGDGPTWTHRYLAADCATERRATYTLVATVPEDLPLGEYHVNLDWYLTVHWNEASANRTSEFDYGRGAYPTVLVRG